MLVPCFRGSSVTPSSKTYTLFSGITRAGFGWFRSAFRGCDRCKWCERCRTFAHGWVRCCTGHEWFIHRYSYCIVSCSRFVAKMIGRAPHTKGRCENIGVCGKDDIVVRPGIATGSLPALHTCSDPATLTHLS